MIRYVLIISFRNGTKTVLLMCLLMISFTLALISISDSCSYKVQRQENEEIYACNMDNLYRLDIMHVNENEFQKIGAGINCIKERLRQEEKVNIGAYYETTTKFDELSVNDEYISLNMNLWNGTIEEQYNEYSKVIFVDPSLFLFLKNDITENMFHSITVDGEEYLPIYAGSNYEGIFSIGEIMTLSRTGEKYIFNGYIEGLNWFGRVPIEDPPRELKDYFIAPFSEADREDSMTQLSTTLCIYAYTTDNGADFEKKAIQIADDYDIKIKISSVREILDKWENKVTNKLLYYRKLTIIVISCSLVSIIAIFAVSVFLNKREIGIKIAYGSSKSKIFINYIISLLSLFLVALSFSYLFVIDRIKKTRTSEMVDIFITTLNKISLSLVFVFGMLIVAIVCIVLFALISCYEPSELIEN